MMEELILKYLTAELIDAEITDGSYNQRWLDTEIAHRKQLAKKLTKDINKWIIKNSTVWADSLTDDQRWHLFSDVEALKILRYNPKRR